MTPRLAVSLALATLVTPACKRAQSNPLPPPSSAAPVPASASGSAEATPPPPRVPPGPLPSATASHDGRLDFIAAPAGDVAPTVLAALRKAGSEGHRLVVFSCTPKSEACTRFKAAALKGDLDLSIRNVTFLEFDGELDHDRLVASGYTSAVMPMFALPGPDGRASHSIAEGAAGKGPIVSFMAMRVQRLLNGPVVP